MIYHGGDLRRKLGALARKSFYGVFSLGTEDVRLK